MTLPPPFPLLMQVSELSDRLLCHLFPKIYSPPVPISELSDTLTRLIAECSALSATETDAPVAARTLLDSTDALAEMLYLDATVLYNGDPAATSTTEVMLCYPGFYATAIHRMAHILYTARVPLLPRMMSELSHSKTGIDIHPGATVGKAFFIDHGTGIVVGETATLGEHVSLYHGVTLGARSIATDADGRALRGTRRHPDIRDGTTIYANATILGGDTVVGEGCIIGEGVRITHSIPQGSIVTQNGDNYRIRTVK